MRKLRIDTRRPKAKKPFIKKYHLNVALPDHYRFVVSSLVSRYEANAGDAIRWLLDKENHIANTKATGKSYEILNVI